MFDGHKNKHIFLAEEKYKDQLFCLETNYENCDVLEFVLRKHINNNNINKTICGK